MAIDRLSSAQELAAGDQFAIYSAENGGDRKIAASAVLSALQDEFVPAGGIMAMSGYYVMRKVPAAPPVNVSVGTAFANFASYDSPPLIFPEGRSSITPMLSAGEFVAMRDIGGVMVWATMSGTWPTNRDLTLAILVGTDASPSESSFQFIASGRGASLVSGSLAAPVANLANPGGVIRAGEKIRLVAKMNVADTLALHRLSFIIQSLDGP